MNDPLLKDFEQLTRAKYTGEQSLAILEALHWACDLHKDQKRASGEPYIIHPIKVAELLINFNMDYQTIIGGLLHDAVEDTETTVEEVSSAFGADVARLVDGVTKIASANTVNRLEQDSETIRKTLFAMSEDIRVVIIKLADKYHNMQTLHYLPPDKQKRIANECLDIYAPLAERLGMSWLKAVLEDLALKHLHPVVYDHIVENLQIQQDARKDYLHSLSKIILKEAKKAGFKIEIQTRAKHLYSIYMKIKKQNKQFNEMYDLLGIRLICSSTIECYSLLGMIHNLWPPIEGRFKDYIAMPKANLYQSLHTTVMTEDGKLLEVQIRTKEMHTLAEHGVAAHWNYKKKSRNEKVKAGEVNIINRLKDWDKKDSNSQEFITELKRDLLKDSIYIFTPEGQMIEMPIGSTPIDFAYRIHSEIGNHCSGARNQSRIIPLHATLKNTDVIEIITSPNAHPKEKWLRIAKTARAKNRIKHWLMHNDPKSTHYVEDTPTPKTPIKEAKPSKSISNLPTPEETTQLFFGQTALNIKAGNQSNYLIKMAGCCHPLPSDEIVGYVSRGRGIIIHKKGCKDFAHIPEIDVREIKVQWDRGKNNQHHHFMLISRPIPDLFSQIDNAIRKYNGSLLQGKITSLPNDNLEGDFIIELKGEKDFSYIKKSLRSIPTTLEITEIHE